MTIVTSKSKAFTTISYRKVFGVGKHSIETKMLVLVHTTLPANFVSRRARGILRLCALVFIAMLNSLNSFKTVFTIKFDIVKV